jgi:anti-sigma regulatory factor (Ser/Thr protein kinase)
MSVSGFRHEAFVYDSDDEFVGQIATFIERGIEEGSSVLAVTTRSNGALLRDALGGVSEQVAFADRADWYMRPAATIAAFHATLGEMVRDGASSLRVVGEVQFGPTKAEWDEWKAYEAIVNRALADHPAWLMCPYDRRMLPGEVIEGASRTHPDVLGLGAQPCLHFDDPADVVRDLAPARDLDGELRSVPPGGDPVAFRERLAAELAAAKVPEAKALKLLVAANEVAVNAFEHAGGPERLRVGVIDGRFVCEVSDRGPGFDSPLAGYLPPKPEAGRGSGLWTARQLTSRLELIPSADGLTVRLWL